MIGDEQVMLMDQVSSVTKMTPRQQEKSNVVASDSTTQNDPEIVETMKKDFPTAVKRNITVRRSRERRSEPTGKLPKDLVGKRATGRSKDIQYRRESGIFIPKDGQPDAPTLITSTIPVEFLNSFLKRDIPDKDEHPQIYYALMKLFDERQELTKTLR
jgi:hypothetical protein